MDYEDPHSAKTLLPEPENRVITDEEDFEEIQEDLLIPSNKSSYDFPIKKTEADKIYLMAGEKIPMRREQLPINISDPITIMIDECVRELNISLELNDMQMRALLPVGHSQDTLVISPCGTGKSLVFYLSVALLRKMRNKKDGVGFILEPLVSI